MTTYVFMHDFLKKDYIIYDAADGDKAWEMIPNLQPNIIISDVMMPGIDGNSLCKLIKNDIRTSHIPVILLTARSTKEQELSGFENGADDYITKPFDLDILILRIRRLLDQQQSRHKNFSKQIDIAPSEITITSLDEKLINKAIKYIEDNINQDELSVEELSHELCMSRTQLYKKLLSITGKTPSEFIRIIRLKRAAQFLKKSQQNVSEIAYMVGFKDPKQFRKYFKEEFGILPSEFQKENGV
nr:helix-turn-helix domain-containing protein [Phocaeicola paurosaccharolyticus]